MNFCNFFQLLYLRFYKHNIYIYFLSDAEKNTPHKCRNNIKLTINFIIFSYESGILEDPGIAAPDGLFEMTKNPEDAPNTPDYISIKFDKGYSF